MLQQLPARCPVRPAKVRGPGLAPGGTYVAKEAMARGLYFLHQVEQPHQEQAPAPGVKVRLTPELVRRIGARKRPGETLDQAVCRLLETLLMAGQGRDPL